MGRVRVLLSSLYSYIVRTCGTTETIPYIHFTSKLHFTCLLFGQ